MILPIDKITVNDKKKVGDKALSLALLNKAHLNIPKAFVITNKAFVYFLTQNNLQVRIEQELKLLNTFHPETLARVSNSIQKLIKNTPLPKDLSKAIFAAYEKLGKKFHDAQVAIRTSTISENIPSGKTDLFLNIKGETSVAELTKEVWASLFSPSILKICSNPLQQKIAVIVQEMINGEISGIVHTLDIRDQNKKFLTIEAIWGNGEYLNLNFVKPDYYFINKITEEIIEKKHQQQYIQLNNKKERKVTNTKQFQFKLTDEQIQTLTKIALKVDRLHIPPQTMEWTFKDGKFYLLQTQDFQEEIIKQNKISEEKNIEPKKEKAVKLHLPLIGEGIGVSSGLAFGEALFVKHHDDLQRVNSEKIIFAEEFSSDLIPCIYQAKAVIAQKGSFASTMAIVARELGIPCVVGIKNLADKIKTGDIITVDGNNGFIYKAKPDLHGREILPLQKNSKTKLTKTITQIFINLPSASNQTIFKDKNLLDGVAMIKGELLLQKLNLHPRKLILQKREQEIETVITDSLEKILRQIPDKNVYYALSDFKSNQMLHLLYGKDFEEKENNPMLGFRGTFKLLFYPELLNIELETFQKLRKKYHNLHLVLPFIRSQEELEQMLTTLTEHGIKNSFDLEIWQILTTPANLINLPQIAAANITGVFVDILELTHFMLGVDGTNTNVANLFNALDPAILWLLKYAAAYLQKTEKKMIISGNLVSTYPYFTKELIKRGIFGLSVSPDLLYPTKLLVQNIENKLINK
ncbi:hypothetical protein GYA19_04035 [Candidatus Beckwithbacteria bacterium]|nr:hypothetical protein [Candidatus Beckwithbacteria bacterium]